MDAIFNSKNLVLFFYKFHQIDYNKLNFLEPTETIVNTNENLINKISLLDEAAQQDLLKFLDSFNLKKK